MPINYGSTGSGTLRNFAVTYRLNHPSRQGRRKPDWSAAEDSCTVPPASRSQSSPRTGSCRGWAGCGGDGGARTVAAVGPTPAARVRGPAAAAAAWWWRGWGIAWRGSWSEGIQSWVCSRLECPPFCIRATASQVKFKNCSINFKISFGLFTV